jgi:hypothetical protein
MDFRLEDSIRLVVTLSIGLCTHTRSHGKYWISCGQYTGWCWYQIYGQYFHKIELRCKVALRFCNTRRMKELIIRMDRTWALVWFEVSIYWNPKCIDGGTPDLVDPSYQNIWDDKGASSKWLTQLIVACAIYVGFHRKFVRWKANGL